VEAVPYELLRAVQDLHGLLHRYALTPAPGQLLSDTAAESPPAQLAEFAVAEELLRGCGCLLANGFPAAAGVLMAQVLLALERLDRDLQGTLPSSVSAYYKTLQAELQLAATPVRAYWLTGEATALYLDILALVHLDGEKLRQQVQRLRAELQEHATLKPVAPEH
jgi:hypothetical protein